MNKCDAPLGGLADVRRRRAPSRWPPAFYDRTRRQKYKMPVRPHQHAVAAVRGRGGGRRLPRVPAEPEPLHRGVRRSRVCRSWCRSRWPSCGSASSCSTAPGSACTSTPWAATPRAPDGPASTSPGCASRPSSSARCSRSSPGLFTVSQVGVVQSSTGRDVVLSGVGAAVIGGVSLFGGRGRLDAGHRRCVPHLDDHQRPGPARLLRRHHVHRHRRRAHARGHHRRPDPASGPARRRWRAA